VALGIPVGPDGAEVRVGVPVGYGVGAGEIVGALLIVGVLDGIGDGAGDSVGAPKIVSGDSSTILYPRLLKFRLNASLTTKRKKIEIEFKAILMLDN
jgi:hypothetical protein